jgi:hypothetical protein
MVLQYFYIFRRWGNFFISRCEHYLSQCMLVEGEGGRPLHCLYNYNDVSYRRILVHGCDGMDQSAAVVTAALSI